MELSSVAPPSPPSTGALMRFFRSPAVIVVVALVLAAAFLSVTWSALGRFMSAEHATPGTPAAIAAPQQAPPLPAPASIQVGTAISNAFSRDEVFNVAENIYKYGDARAVCAAFGAKLATVEQVRDAWKRGADWCNYGWVDGQMAVYPTQQASWDRIQKGPPEQRNNCGLPGVNGGYFDNPNLQFGVNCYGIRPPEKQSDHENALIPIRSSREIAFDQEVARYKAQLGKIGVLPFQPGAWAASIL